MFQMDQNSSFKRRNCAYLLLSHDELRHAKLIFTFTLNRVKLMMNLNVIGHFGRPKYYNYILADFAASIQRRWGLDGAAPLPTT